MKRILTILAALLLAAVCMLAQEMANDCIQPLIGLRRL